MPIQAPKETPAIQQVRASGLMRLRPVERRGGVGQLAGAVVERALAAADAAEIEAQHREAALHEAVVQIVDDLVVHRAAELRMRMQHDRDRRAPLLRRLIAAFDAAGGAGEDDLRHPYLEPLDRRRSAAPWARQGPARP